MALENCRLTAVNILKKISLFTLSVVMMFAGLWHFIRPAPYIGIVPKYLPFPAALVYISGFFEILGGIGLLVPEFRTTAAWGLFALFIAVFPANINMAMNHVTFNGFYNETFVVWRLPAQILLLAWAWWHTREA